MESKGKINFKMFTPLLSLLIICSVTTGLLAFVKKVTDESIKKQGEEVVRESCRRVLPEGKEFIKSDEKYGDIIEFYTAKDGGETIIGYVFITEAKGYGGQITVMTGIFENGNISGIDIVESFETPGLGQKSEEEWFRDRYKMKHTVAEVSEVEGITGATITSKAVTEAVSKALLAYQLVVDVD